MVWTRFASKMLPKTGEGGGTVKAATAKVVFAAEKDAPPCARLGPVVEGGAS